MLKGSFIAFLAMIGAFAMSAAPAAADTHTITVTKIGSGSGTVTSAPSGISCGTTCSGPFDSSELVSLSAVADVGSEFVGWSGCTTLVHFSCFVSAETDANVTAEFGPGPPEPPPGPVGVSINRDARYTNDPHVKLSMIWPEGTSFASISNTPEFSAPKGIELAPLVSWLLADGSSRKPKTVHVKFDDSGPTYSDDIVLDEFAPKIRSVSARAERGSSTAVLRIGATDRISGVARMQVSTRKSPRVTKAKFRKKFVMDLHVGHRFWVRVFDRAGNASRWKAVRVR